jgi:TolB-like protein
MAKDPNKRPQDGAAAAKLIESALAGATPAPTVAMSPVRKRRLLPAFALLALVLVSTVAWFAWRKAQPGPGQPAVAAEAAAVEVDRSIAVLPLANLSGKAENEYFSDGLAETTLDMLARVPELRVIARSSSFAFKGKDMDAREIGKALGAAHLLRGSVQQSGDQVRITVQLIRSSDGANLWSNKYDRKLADVFKIQDEVATEVVTALQGALAQDDRRRLLTRRTENVAAYQEYLKGNALLPLRKIDDLREALAHFQRAIDIDPDYARAHTGAANALLLLQSHASLTPEQYKERDEHIRRALSLDPDLGEAYVAQAGSLQSTDTGSAELAFKHGLELAPNYATGWQWYAEFLSNDRGQPEQALPMLLTATRLDPLAPVIRTELAHTYLKLGKIAEAERISDQLIAKYPQFAPGYSLKADIAGMRNDLVGSLRAVDQRIAADPSSVKARGERCNVLLGVGAVPEAKACALALKDRAGLESWRAQFELQLAAIDGDLQRAGRVMATQSHTPPWQQALVLRQTGRHAEALELYRGFLPELLAQPLGEPKLASIYDANDLGALLNAMGRGDQAKTILRYGLAATRNRLRYGNSGLSFGRVYAYTLLGEFDKACADLNAAADEGYFQSYLILAADSDLVELRKQACFAPAYARVKAGADKQIALARKAGLL